MAESAPCPLIAAGFCERAGGSQGRAAPAQRRRQAPLTRPPGSGSCQAARGQGARGGAECGSAVQAGGLSMRGDLPWRPGTGREQPALPRSAGHRRCPGDMMIDRVSPPAGMRPLSLIRPSAWPCGAGPAAADSGSAGAGRGGPHRVSWAAVCPAGAGLVTDWSPWHGVGGLRRRRARRRRARPGCGRPGGGSCGPRTGRRACRCTGP